MTNKTSLRIALLGSAALVATVSAASADQIDELKAQLASLQTQVNGLQATQLSALTAGGTLIQMTQGGAENGLGYTFSVVPTADMPAATTSVTVSGEVRGVGKYVSKSGDQADDHDWSIGERARVKVVGNTATSVGDVGAAIRLQGVNGDTAETVVNLAYGTWQLSPEWQLLAGRTDNAAAIQAGTDWMFTGATTGAVGGPTNDSSDQFRLNYKSGPVSGAVSIENYNGDADHGTPAVGAFIGLDAAAGTTVYVSGVAGKDSKDGSNTDYFAGIGANVAVGSALTLTAAAGKGEGYKLNSAIALDSSDVAYWGASIGAIYALSETTSLEVGYGVSHADNSLASVKDASAATAQVIWTPVKQLSVSAGAGYAQESLANGQDNNTMTAGVGTWFRF